MDHRCLLAQLREPLSLDALAAMAFLGPPGEYRKPLRPECT
jgi:hypothetical protein